MVRRTRQIQMSYSIYQSMKLDLYLCIVIRISQHKIKFSTHVRALKEPRTQTVRAFDTFASNRNSLTSIFLFIERIKVNFAMLNVDVEYYYKGEHRTK